MVKLCRHWLAFVGISRINDAVTGWSDKPGHPDITREGSMLCSQDGFGNRSGEVW